MEEHLGSQKSFIAHVNIDRFASIGWLMHILFELIAQIPLAILSLLFFIKLFVFLGDVLANVAILFLDHLRDFEGVFTGKWLLPVPKVIKNKLCDVSACKWDVLDA